MSDHTLIRSTLVPEIATLLEKYYGITENEALDRFYASKTAMAFADDECGLYGMSALFLAREVIFERDGVVDVARF